MLLSAKVLLAKLRPDLRMVRHMDEVDARQWLSIVTNLLADAHLALSCRTTAHQRLAIVKRWP